MEVIGMFLLLAPCPSVSSLDLTGPPTHDARLGSDVEVTCWFTVDKIPVDLNHLTIFWHFLNKEILSYEKTVRTTSPRYSLSAEASRTGIADLIINNVEIPDGGRYKCSVIYGSERKEKDVWLYVGASPQVTITHKTVVLNEKSVLRCSATGFFPSDIGIKWFRNGEKLEDNIIVGDPWRNPDKTYSVNSTVTITATEEDRDRIFSCRVQHRYLQEPLQEDFHLVCEDRSSAGIIAACSVLVIILIIIIAGGLWWRRKAFTVTNIMGPAKLIAGEEAVLYCAVDNTPKDLCVTWLIMRGAGEEQKIHTSQMRGHSEEEEESLLDTSYVIRSERKGHLYLSSLSFIPRIEKHKDATFICRGVSGQHKDEKTFHCKRIYGKPKMLQRIIKSLFICGELKYLLNLDKFYPKSIKIVWTCGREMTEVVSTDTISENPDSSYSVSSEVVIPEDRHKDPGFRVRVTWEHESMEKPESRELSIRDSDYRWTPVVGDIQVPRLLLGSPAALQCNISGYFPDAVTVKWMRRNGDMLHEETDDNQRITSRRAADNTYSRTASLTITPNLRTHEGAEYICVVEHPSLETPIERSTGSLQVWGKPQMSAPIHITMEDSSRVQFSLNLQKVYPKDINISWRWKDTAGEHVLSAVNTISSQNDDVTYEVSSVVQIAVHPFTDPEIEIIVEWKHESLETPERRSLSARDLPWRPHIGSIHVPWLVGGRAATLTCAISRYFPNVLSVTWFIKKDGNITALPREPSNVEENGTALPRESSDVGRNYKMSEKKTIQPDHTYSCEASLTFTPIISSHQGSEIICRVEHPSEERPIERSTGPLHIDDIQEIFKNVRQMKKETFTPDPKNKETGEKEEVADENMRAEPQEETNILTDEADGGGVDVRGLVAVRDSQQMPETEGRKPKSGNCPLHPVQDMSGSRPGTSV